MAESFQRLSVSAGSAFEGAAMRNGSKTVPPVPKEQSSMKNRMHSMTIDILGTYSKCNPKFRVVDKLPQRVLTNPSEGVANNSADNEEANLICRVHDQIICSHTCYTILDLLGTGTFGQVFRCQKDGTKEVVAIKIIKNKAAYHSQGLLEIKIARLLNNTFDPKDERHIVRLLDSFEFNNHICLVFELLSMSLLDILTQNQFRGLPLTVVQRFTRQIIAAMVTLEDANIIHCDLKPENILLAPPKAHKKPSPPPLKRKNDVMQEGSLSSVTGRDPQRPNMLGNNGSLNGAAKEGHGMNQNQNYTISSAPTTPPPALILSPDSGSGSSSRDADSASAMLSTDVSHAIVTPDNTGQSADDHSAAAASGSSSRAGGGHGEEHTQTQAGIAQAGGRLSMWSDVKVIDLGSACFEGRTMYSYIQSRFCE
jgi:serine/threonine protein kinase